MSEDDLKNSLGVLSHTAEFKAIDLHRALDMLVQARNLVGDAAVLLEHHARLSQEETTMRLVKNAGARLTQACNEVSVDLGVATRVVRKHADDRLEAQTDALPKRS